VDFELNDEQRMLQDSVQRLLTDHYSFTQRRDYLSQSNGWSNDLWQRYAELGLLGLDHLQDEDDGGTDVDGDAAALPGMSAVDTMIVMQAMGRALTLEPYLASVVMCGSLLRSAGTPEQRRTLLPQLSAGKLILALAHGERQARYDLPDVVTSATQVEDGWQLDGEKTLVMHGGSAHQYLVSARLSGARHDRDGLALFLVDAQAPGVTRRSYQTHDHLDAADLQLKQVHVGPHDLIGEAGSAYEAIEHAWQRGIAAVCAEAVGAMESLLDTTISYLKTRQQFGVPIGNFQVLQHRAVDMFIALEQARSMTIYATMMVDDPDPLERARALSAAKIQIGKSARYVGQQAIQLHGGIGMTDEYPVGHYVRRTTLIEFMFGDAEHHTEQLANLGGLQ